MWWPGVSTNEANAHYEDSDLGITATRFGGPETAVSLTGFALQLHEERAVTDVRQVSLNVAVHRRLAGRIDHLRGSS